uniref:Chitin-binding type-2 domain-containing protein n=1 Tax=Syphacia muris TaxID=451379 RepID=A0A158R5K8_9BILA
MKLDVNEYKSLRISLNIAFAADNVNIEENLDLKSGTQPKYWRAILGDICQLPSFPRATGDPVRYVECVRQNSDVTDRKDLGIWLLRECLPGYEFVASARRCKTIRSVKRQQELCDGPNATNYQFCPQNNNSNEHFIVHEIRQAPKQCACPNGEKNCVCPTPEILEPKLIRTKVVRRRNAPMATISVCSVCPSKSSSCYCPVSARNFTNHLFSDYTIISIDSPLQSSSQQVVEGPQSPQWDNMQMPGPIPVRPFSPSPELQRPSYVSEQPVQVVQQAQTQAQTTVQSQTQAPVQPYQGNCQTTTTQQQYCPQNDNEQYIVQPQPCPLVQGQSTMNAQYQGICSWMVDPLAVDQQSRSHYLQCQPAPNNLFCGRWQRMPCAPATVFDVNAQVCVWDSASQSMPGSIPTATQVPMQYQPSVTTAIPISVSTAQPSTCACTGGVQIGSCNSNYQCPGQSVCQVGGQAGKQV